MISETSLYLLGVTLLASLLHLLFECLAFQSDISFWQSNKSLAGLSARTVVTDLISQLIVFLFLMDSDTSLLVTIPAGFGLLVQAWKMQKATGLGIEFGSWGVPVVVFRRWQSQPAIGEGTEDAVEEKEEETRETKVASSSGANSVETTEERLTKVTLEADR